MAKLIFKPKPGMNAISSVKENYYTTQNKALNMGIKKNATILKISLIFNGILICLLVLTTILRYL